MINAIYKKHGLRINAIWFCRDTREAINHNKTDFIFFHGIQENCFINAISSIQYTLMTDLAFPSEAIFKKFSKNYQYEINRAKKENVECLIFKAGDLIKNPAILSAFKREYVDFTKIKGIQNTYNEYIMKEYIAKGNVLLTKAFKGDEDYAQHIYVCDGQDARLLYSVSNFRTEGLDRNLVGRANKYLHWNDIQYLQNHEYQTLDWGGISNMTNPNGVDKFKIEFGGHEHKYYNVIIGKSLIGWLAIFAMKVKGRICI